MVHLYIACEVLSLKRIEFLALALSRRQGDKQGTEKKVGEGIDMAPCLGLIMRNSGLLLILTSMFISGSAQATLANCPACMGKQPDWTQSATAFLEGKPIGIPGKHR